VNKTRWTDWFMITVFLCLITVPMLLTRTDISDGSENRIKSNLDKSIYHWSRLGEIPDNVEGFYNDHFGLRNRLVTLYSVINVIFGVSPKANVITGSDDWLYLAEENVLSDISGQRMFTPEELELWQRYLKIKYNALRDRGIGYLFIAVPNKHTIYPEHLPKRYQYEDQYTRTNQWIDFMREETDVPILDLRQMLAQKAAIMPIYSPSDTHWTEFGATCVQEAVINALRQQGLKRFAIHYLPDDFNMKTQQGGDLAGLLSLKSYFRSQIPIMKIKKSKVLLRGIHKVSDKHNTMFSRLEEIYECSLSQGRLFLFGDSFVNSFHRFMSPFFNMTLVARMHNHQMRHLDPLIKYVDEFKPDYVVELRVGRFLLDTVPENPPAVNLSQYPDWVKKHFSLGNQPVELIGLENKMPLLSNESSP